MLILGFYPKTAICVCTLPNIIDERTLTTHDNVGEACDYAGKRQLSCLNSGDEVTVSEALGHVV